MFSAHANANEANADSPMSFGIRPISAVTDSTTLIARATATTWRPSE
jgi:hypothetical protein